MRIFFTSGRTHKGNGAVTLTAAGICYEANNTLPPDQTFYPHECAGSKYKQSVVRYEQQKAVP